MLLVFYCFCSTVPAMSEELIQQRSVIKFMCKMGKTPMQCWTALHEVFQDKTVTLKTVHAWYHKFDRGVESVKDLPRPGRPCNVHTEWNIQKVQAAVLTDRRATMDTLAQTTSLSRSSVHNIVKKDLNFSKLAPKFVPCLLTQEQKDFCKRLCDMNLQSLKEDGTFLSCIITGGDGTWISIFEMELKKDSREWHLRGTHADCPLKAIRNRSYKKVMLTVFYDQEGVATTDFLQWMQIIIALYSGS